MVRTNAVSPPLKPIPNTARTTKSTSCGGPNSSTVSAATSRTTQMRITDHQGGEAADQAEPASEDEEGVAPAEPFDEPGRHRPGDDEAHVEARQHEGQDEAPLTIEPARDGGRGDDVEARRADAAHEADEEIELPQRVDRRGEREARPRHRDREGQDEARAVAIGDGPHDEGVEAAQHQGRRERDRDGAPAPAEVLGQHRQEDAERGDGARGAEHDGEERAGNQPALAHERRGAHRALTIHAVWYAMRVSTWPRPRSGSASPSSASRTRVS